MNGERRMGAILPTHPRAATHIRGKLAVRSIMWHAAQVPRPDQSERAKGQARWFDDIVARTRRVRMRHGPDATSGERRDRYVSAAIYAAMRTRGPTERCAAAASSTCDL